MGAVFARRLVTAGQVPAAAQTALGELLVNTADGKLFLRTAAGVVALGAALNLIKAPVWSGGVPAPLESYEFAQRVYLFAAGQGETLVSWVRVPAAYTPGTPVILRVQAYTPSTSNNVRVQATTTLVRKGLDAITSTANQRTVTQDQANTSTANLLTELALQLTDANGLVGTGTVNPGDLLQIQLSRGVPAATDDTANDLRLIADAAELTFN